MSEFTFKLPDLGEGLVEAEIAEWMVKPGDSVEEEDVICAVMTDKAAVELTAPVTGKVLSTTGEPGDMVAVGSALIVFQTSGEVSKAPTDDGKSAHDRDTAGSDDTAQAPHSASPQTEHAAKVNERPARILTSPAIRQRAREAGIDLGQVQGNGPKGRIQSADLDAFMAGGSGNTAAAITNKDARKQPSSAVKEIKVVGLRRVIAERMAAANTEVPQFNYVEECDITALESLRQHLNDQKAADEPKLTPLPFIGLALIRALAQFPQCNALYDKERNIISQYAAVHLGIATQTPTGLKVAVVKNSDTLGLKELSNEIRRVSASAKDNSAKRDELMGSTITITSLGKLGGIVTAPIINQPEVGIIGINKAVERPMVVNGQVVIRTMMNISSSFDHRFVDGYDVAMMIQTVKGFLEQPATIFMP